MDNPVLRVLGPLGGKKKRREEDFFMQFCSFTNSHSLPYCVQGNNKQQQLAHISRQKLTQRGKKRGFGLLSMSW